jgi:hypothetical protein
MSVYPTPKVSAEGLSLHLVCGKSLFQISAQRPVNLIEVLCGSVPYH